MKKTAVTAAVSSLLSAAFVFTMTNAFGGAIDAHSVYNCDVNGDGVVNTADVVALKKYLLMVYSAKAINGDVNKDGEINALDMMRLVKKLLG